MEQLYQQAPGLAAILIVAGYFLKALAARDRVIERIAERMDSTIVSNTQAWAAVGQAIQKCKGPSP